MNHAPYSYTRIYAFRYTFLSRGKKDINKIVEFTPLGVENIYNLGFGDLLANGKIDDKAISNSGDMIKIISTVIQITREFTEEFPHYKIYFAGSNPQRSRLYRRILKTYFKDFSEIYIITALADKRKLPVEVPFDPASNNNYLAFFAKRID